MHGNERLQFCRLQPKTVNVTLKSYRAVSTKHDFVFQTNGGIMVKSCSAYGCTQRYTKGVTFHTFPLGNKTLLKKWLVALHRKNFVPTKHTVICTRHFTADDYQHRSGRLKYATLKPNAVPSVFDFPQCELRWMRKSEDSKSKADSESPPSQPQTEINDESVIPSSSTIMEHTDSVCFRNETSADQSKSQSTYISIDHSDNSPAFESMKKRNSMSIVHSVSPDNTAADQSKSKGSFVITDHSYCSGSPDNTAIDESKAKDNSLSKDHSYCFGSPTVHYLQKQTNGAPADLSRRKGSSTIIHQSDHSTSPYSIAADESERAHCHQSSGNKETSGSSRKAALRLKIKTLEQKLCQKEKKIKELTTAMEKLKEETQRNSKTVPFPENSLSGLAKEIYMNKTRNIAKGANGRRYSEELKKFALTVYFYSPRAYSLLRRELCLPAPSTLYN